MRSNVNDWRLVAPLALICAAAPAIAQDDGAPPPSTGPAGTSQATPGAERYDAVGYAEPFATEARPRAFTGVHNTLPAGSFAEVTALDGGKTIIVIIVDRGVAAGRIIALSPAAMAALGGDGAGFVGVRVRRVNPPGADQQALRDGQAASPRIDAPPVLLTALRKRLPAAPARTLVRVPAKAPSKAPVKVPPKAASRAGASYAQPGRPETPPVTKAPLATAAGPGFYVQVAALSNAARATALANDLGGSVQPSGGLYRVRLGPFDNVAAANRARDGVVHRGYGGAQIIKP